MNKKAFNTLKRELQAEQFDMMIGIMEADYPENVDYVELQDNYASVAQTCGRIATAETLIDITSILQKESVMPFESDEQLMKDLLERVNKLMQEEE